VATQSLTIRSPQDVVQFINFNSRTMPIWVLLIAYGGIFIDAYDSFSLGIGVPQIQQQFHLTALQLGSLTASLAIGAIGGALVGGYYVDKVGRLRMFMLDLVFFVVAAVGAAVSTNLFVLVAFRLLMGVGIGLDYPVALSFVAEYSSLRGKAKNVAFWIVVNSIVAIFIYVGVALPLYLAGAGPNLWRWVLGLGAVPAAVILVLRYIFLEESPMWMALHGDLHGAAQVLERTYKIHAVVDPSAKSAPRQQHKWKDYAKLFSKKYRKRTLLISIVCPLQSMEYYAIAFYFPSILLLLVGKQFVYVILGSAFLNIFALLGGIAAMFLTQQLGLRPLLIVTLSVVALSLIVTGLTRELLPMSIAVGLIGLFNFAHAAGPGHGGMTMATLSYPTSMRGAGTGWAQGTLRVGSTLGFLLFPMLLSRVGLSKTLLCLAVVPVANLVACLAIRWEPVGRDIDAEDLAEAKACGAS